MDVDVLISIVTYSFIGIIGLAILSFVALKIKDYYKKKKGK